MLNLQNLSPEALYKKLKEEKKLELSDDKGVYNTSLTISYNEKFHFNDFKEKLISNKYKTLIFKVV